MEYNRPKIKPQTSMSTHRGKQGTDSFVNRKKELVVYSDSASRSNPGLAGAGAVMQDTQGQTLEHLYRYLGDHLTNNMAEYEAAIMGLERAVALGADAVTLRADSELMIKQLRGEYRVRNEALKSLHQRATQLLDQFDRVTLEHIPRHFNQKADALANRAIDEWRSLGDDIIQAHPIREVVINDQVSLVVGIVPQVESLLQYEQPDEPLNANHQSQPQLSRRRQRIRQFEL
jgi:ribonuclease HI